MREFKQIREVFDQSEGVLYIERTEDVEPVMDDLREEQHLNPGGWNESRSMKHLGSIPLVIVDQWMHEDPPFNILDGRPETALEVVRRLKNMPKFLLEYY